MSDRAPRPAWSTTSRRSCARCGSCCARRASRPCRRETAEEALDRAAIRPPDAAIVDLVLPDGDGVEVTRRLREWSAMPIIVLSAVGDEGEKVRALEAGADDYVTKPFGSRELVARLQAALRRTDRPADEPVISSGDLTIDLAARIVRVAGEAVHLTPIEFDLLRTLARNRGRLLTHRALLVEVWGPEYANDTAVLRTHIANLRRKIGPQHVPRTDPGVGYRASRLDEILMPAGICTRLDARGSTSGMVAHRLAAGRLIAVFALLASALFLLIQAFDRV